MKHAMILMCALSCTVQAAQKISPKKFVAPPAALVNGYLRDLFALTVFNNNVAQVEALLNTFTIDINIKDDYGSSALMCACYKGNSVMVAFLIGKGIDVNAANRDGETACIICAQENEVESLKILINAGADVNKKDNKKRTAVDYALDKGHQEAAEFLTNNDGFLNFFEWGHDAQWDDMSSRWEKEQMPIDCERFTKIERQ